MNKNTDTNKHQIIKIDNQEFNIAKSTRLHIKMTDACNAICPFCVARLGKLREEHIIDNLQQKIDVAINKLNVKNVVLLGGEPTISKNLFPILNELKSYKDDLSEITIITNGVKLHDMEFVRRLSESPITAVNISIHHWETQRNDDLMHIKSLERNELIQIRDILHKNNKQLWLSVVLMKGVVDSAEKILKYIKHFATVVDQIRMFPISYTKEHETISEVANFTKSHLLEVSDLNNMIKEALSYGEKVDLDPQQFNLNAYSSALIYGQQVIFKNTEIHKDKDDEKNNLIYSIKLLPSGKLTNTYHDRGLDLYNLLR